MLEEGVMKSVQVFQRIRIFHRVWGVIWAWEYFIECRSVI